MSNRTFFILSALVLLLYMFLFPVRLDKEIILRPESVLDKNTSIAPRTDGFSWQMGDSFGFIDSNNNFARYESEYASVDGGSLAVVSDGNGAFKILSSEGETISSFETDGIPLLRGGRLFVLSVEQGFIAEYSLAGTRLWNYQFIYPVTCLDANSETLVIGDLGGQCHIINTSGNADQVYVPSGSRFSCLYSVSVSEDSERIVMITGKEPQRFLLLEKRVSGYQPVKHFNLENSFSRSLFTDFTHDDSRIVIEGKNELIVYHIEDSSLVSLPMNGNLYGFYYDEETGLQALLYKRGDYQFGLEIYTSGEKIYYKREFKAEEAFVRFFNQRLYIGQDSQVLCAGIKRL